MTRSANGTVYDLTGPPDAPVVVLVHGLGLSRAVWQWLIPVLAPQFRVLSYDLFGHGDSAPPPTLPDLRLLADQIFALLDTENIAKAALVGFSLGGMVVRRAAQDCPGRVTALGILNSPHRRSPAAQDRVWQRVAQAKTDGPAATVDAALDRWFSAGFRAANPDAMAMVRGWVMANDPAIYPQFYAVFAGGLPEIIAPQPPIACPALVITGDCDLGNGPDMAQAIAAEIAGATSLTLPNLSHMALMEDPPAVNGALLRFLQTHIRDIHD